MVSVHRHRPYKHGIFDNHWLLAPVLQAHTTTFPASQLLMALMHRLKLNMLDKLLDTLDWDNIHMNVVDKNYRVGLDIDCDHLLVAEVGE